MKIIVHTEYELPENEFERAEWLKWYVENRLNAILQPDEVEKFKKNGYAELKSKDPTSDAMAVTTYHLKKDDY